MKEFSMELDSDFGVSGRNEIEIFLSTGREEEKIDD